MKSLVKKIIPENVVLLYHKLHAYMAALFYGFPSRKMKVIGITGTKGKTSTANFIWAVLHAGGKKTGLIGTANIRIGEVERMNIYHMTMPSPWIIQKLLKEMLDSGCEYVVMEVTSEGIKQNRHIGIDFSVGVFTNISPEHLPSHKNSFDVYLRTKASFFKTIRKDGYVLINADDSQAEYIKTFSSAPVETFGIEKGNYIFENILETRDGLAALFDGIKVKSPILGKFNLYNIAPAVCVGKHENLDKVQIEQGIKDLQSIPGRMEKIKMGQSFTVIVDYAHEQKSRTALADALNAIKTSENSKVYVLYGAEGGGRDKRKRGEMTRVLKEKGIIGIITTVDPYDENPEDINNDILRYAENFGMKEGKDIFVIHDRKEAIRFALEQALPSDIVCIAGKGAEQSMILPTGSIDWDDRVITRGLLTELGYANN